jgi:hypothetical protein
VLAPTEGLGSAALVGGVLQVVTSAIIDMGPIMNLKGVQCVTGCLAALSRFIE